MKKPELLQTDVVEELGWDPAVDSSGIGVTIRDSVVTLTGKVKSYAEKLAAERAVKRVAGVKAVADDLQIAYAPKWIRDDSTIAQNAVDALNRHVSIPVGAVTPFVTNGWIKLEGMVNWDYQRRAAEKAVRYLPGVHGVTNLITLKKTASRTEVKDKIEAAFRRNAQIDADHVMVEVADGNVTLKGTVSSWYERDQAENAAWAAPGVMQVKNNIMVEVPVRTGW